MPPWTRESAYAEGWSNREIQEAAAEASTMSAWLSEEEQYKKLRDLFARVIERQGLKGHIEAFGSYRSGIRIGASDLDVVYLPTEREEAGEGENELTPTMILQLFAVALRKHGFKGITPVYMASMPLVKCLSPEGAEVDLCVGNRLGVQNSRLMAAYANLDTRVQKVGQQVKHWAKCCDIACSSDGHLSSYAYTLMTIFYLQYTEPPVLPNLQAVAAAADPDTPVQVRDNRWGCETWWDCKFLEDTDIVPASSNKQGVEELVAGFFNFYANIFDWQRHAVSIRLGRKVGLDDIYPGKVGLLGTTGSTVWYIEDPFDLKHNLASNTTVAARQRILDKAHEVLMDMRKIPRSPLDVLLAQTLPKTAWLKCRVHHEKTSKKDFCEHLRGYPIQGFFWPQQSSFASRTEAFFKFASDRDRRTVHQLNETYVGTWQMRLLTCSAHAMEDAVAESSLTFEEVDLALLKGPDPSETRPIDDIEQVKAGLRKAQSKEEVNVLVQRAKALGLRTEEREGERIIRDMPGQAGGQTKSNRPEQAAGGEDASLAGKPYQSSPVPTPPTGTSAAGKGGGKNGQSGGRSRAGTAGNTAGTIAFQ
eukprot:TRINITY_DN33373_c0_g1_i1.p1 TRINITY_DN33373_c0_g1~~TRINITY_DN33373_c0_g1_i1.p1  ORF type:complete len:590 (+),score=131.93 TRINITY_DN33373_c0_g1_i1:80-1849(+)